MNLQIILSAITAFVIGAGGAIVVVAGSGNDLNKTAWILSCVLGGITAAKDVRSLLKMPPVETGNTAMLARNQTKNPPVV